MARTKTTPRKVKHMVPLSKEYVSSDSSTSSGSNTSLTSGTNSGSSTSNTTNNSSSSGSSSSINSSSSRSNVSNSSSSSSNHVPEVSSSTSTVDYNHLTKPAPLKQASEIDNKLAIPTTSTHPLPTKPAPRKAPVTPSITRFNCNLCPKHYSRLQTLKRHVLDVHMDRGRSYECPVCNKRLTRSDSLRVHMRRVHHMIDTPKIEPTPRPTIVDKIIPIESYTKPWESLTKQQQQNPVFQVRKARQDYNFKHSPRSINNNPGRSILYRDNNGHYSTTKGPNMKPTVVKNLYGVYTTKRASPQPATSISMLEQDLYISDTDSNSSEIHPNFWAPDDFLIIDEC